MKHIIMAVIRGERGIITCAGMQVARNHGWYIIMQPSTLCGVHYKGTTWTVDAVIETKDAYKIIGEDRVGVGTMHETTNMRITE